MIQSHIKKPFYEHYDRGGYMNSLVETAVMEPKQNYGDPVERLSDWIKCKRLEAEITDQVYRKALGCRADDARGSQAYRADLIAELNLAALERIKATYRNIAARFIVEGEEL